MPEARQDKSGNLSDLEWDHKLRTIAIELAVQLPAEQADALKVLEYARSLVIEFLPGKPPASPQIRAVS